MKEERRKRKKKKKKKEEKRRNKEERRKKSAADDADGLQGVPMIRASPPARGGARSAFTQVRQQVLFNYFLISKTFPEYTRLASVFMDAGHPTWPGEGRTSKISRTPTRRISGGEVCKEAAKTPVALGPERTPVRQSC